MDIVASRFNNTLNKFIAKTMDLLAFTVDANVILWTAFQLIYLSSNEDRLSTTAHIRGGQGPGNFHCTKVAHKNRVHIYIEFCQMTLGLFQIDQTY